MFFGYDIKLIYFNGKTTGFLYNKLKKHQDKNRCQRRCITVKKHREI